MQTNTPCEIILADGAGHTFWMPHRLADPHQRPDARHVGGLQPATCQAMTINTSSVEICTPPMSTRLRPSAKTSPATTRAMLNGKTPSAPVNTTVAKIAPNAMNPPPRTLRDSRGIASCPALATPSPPAFSAISGGSRPSMAAKACGRGFAINNSAAEQNQANDLHCDDLHNGRGRKDHSVANVRPLGWGHSRGIHENRRVPGRA